MNIKLLFMDVDGTLTDGKIYVGDNGEVMKAFDIKDGYAIRHILPRYGIIPVIITGRTSKIVESRAKELNISELHQGITDKNVTLIQVMNKYDCKKDNCAYIGDDVLDLPGMQQCGIVGCPGNSVDEVKNISQYICNNNGGQGAVREFIEWLVGNS